MQPLLLPLLYLPVTLLYCCLDEWNHTLDRRWFDLRCQQSLGWWIKIVTKRLSWSCCREQHFSRKTGHGKFFFAIVVFFVLFFKVTYFENQISHCTLCVTLKLATSWPGLSLRHCAQGATRFFLKKIFLRWRAVGKTMLNSLQNLFFLQMDDFSYICVNCMSIRANTEPFVFGFVCKFFLRLAVTAMQKLLGFIGKLNIFHKNTATHDQFKNLTRGSTFRQ